jgi:hypothetical protein
MHVLRFDSFVVVLWYVWVVGIVHMISAVRPHTWACLYDSCSLHSQVIQLKCIYSWLTQCGPKVWGLISLKIEDMRMTYTFFLFKISSIGIYTGFCVVVQFLKSWWKFPFFGLSLIHQLWLLRSQQHPQSGVVLTLFSTWGSENSLAEIHLESTGVIKGCNIFWGGQKLAIAALWVGTLSCNKKKSREQNAAGWTCWMHFRRWSITPLYNYAFTIFPLVQILCALCLESWKKLSMWCWFGTFGISFSSAEGMSDQPIQNSVALFQGHRQNTRSHLP